MGYPTTVVDTTVNRPVHDKEKLHDFLTKSDSDALTESDLIVRSPDGEVTKFGVVTVPQTGTVAVTFSTAFATGQIPTVATTPQATIAGFDLVLTNVTEAGFELGFDADPGATKAVGWIASL